MSSPYVGQYTANLYNASKRYRMMFAKGVALADSEVREIQEVSDSFVRQLVSLNFPSGSSYNDGFKVTYSSSPINNFTIKGGNGTVNGAGVLFVDGYILFLKNDIEFNQQDATGALTDDDYTKSTISAYNWTSGTENGSVWVDFYFAEVSSVVGSEYQDSTLNVAGIGVPTANRVRQVQDIIAFKHTTYSDIRDKYPSAVQSSTDSALWTFTDANGIFHRCVKIANIERNAAAITATASISTITDTRTHINSLRQYIEGTTYPTSLLGITTIGNSSNRIDTIWMASKIDYASDLILQSSGEKVRFTTGGGLGIGTSSLGSAKLQVQGLTKLVQSTLGLSNGLLIYSPPGNATDGYIDISMSAADFGSIQVSDNIGVKTLLLNPNGGNIGIGTHTPVSAVHINAGTGTLTITGNLSVTGTTTTINTEVTTTDRFQIDQDENQVALLVNKTGTGAGNAFELNNSGTGNALIIMPVGAGNAKVGIGTSVPVSIFQITDTNGSFVVDGSSISYNRIKSATVNPANGKDLLLSAQTAGATPDLYIKSSNGFIGITTANPQNTLHVNGNAYINNVYTPVNGILSLSGNGSSVVGLISPDGTTLHLRTNSTSQAVVDATGNFGIGTTGPTAKVHILSGPTNTVKLQWSSATNNKNELAFVNSTNTLIGNIEQGIGAYRKTFADSYVANANDLVINNVSNAALLLATNDRARLSINAAGLVGVGTTSANDLVDLYGSSTQYLRISNASDTLTNIGGIKFVIAGSETAKIEAERIISGGRGSVLKFFSGNSTSDNEGMRLTEIGNVCIGTTIATHKLEVAGNIYSSTGLGIGSSPISSMKAVIIDPVGSLIRLGIGTSTDFYETNLLTLNYGHNVSSLNRTASLKFSNNTNAILLAKNNTGSGNHFIGLNTSVADQPFSVFYGDNRLLGITTSSGNAIVTLGNVTYPTTPTKFENNKITIGADAGITTSSYLNFIAGNRGQIEYYYDNSLDDGYYITSKGIEKVLILDSQIEFGTTISKVLLKNPSSLLGIGTSDSTNPLEVWDNTSRLFKVYDSDSGSGFYPAVDIGTDTAYCTLEGTALTLGLGINNTSSSPVIRFKSGQNRIEFNNTQTSLITYVSNSVKQIIGVNTTTNYNYTKLGSTAPAIKQKKLTGTMAAGANGTVSVSHGVTGSKILSVDIFVDDAGGPSYHTPPNAFSAGYLYNYIINDSTNTIDITNGPSAVGIYSKSFRCFVTYED